MHAGEIITARRLGLKIIVVVFSDGELNLIKVKQSWKRINPYGIYVYNGPFFELWTNSWELMYGVPPIYPGCAQRF